MLLDVTRKGPQAQNLLLDLQQKIIGQVDAIDSILEAYQTYLAGFCVPGKPLGNFLFLGPTGSGKTRTVEAFAESLTKNSRSVIKIDCAEFAHSHEIAKLIGSPPGYLGHRETHPMLSQEALNQYHTDTVKVSFVLFDEIEKSSDSLWNLLLGIMDKATLTLGDNRKVDFSKCFIFLTSNLGAREMNSLLVPNVGFHTPQLKETQIIVSKLEEITQNAARKKFTPEFINRIDKTVVFKPLTDNNLRDILEIELKEVQNRIFLGTFKSPIIFECTAAAKNFLLEEGADIKYGARQLKRIIERKIVNPIANLFASEQLQSNQFLKIDYAGEGKDLIFMAEDSDEMIVKNEIVIPKKKVKKQQQEIDEQYIVDLQALMEGQIPNG